MQFLDQNSLLWNQNQNPILYQCMVFICFSIAIDNEVAKRLLRAEA